MPFECRVPKTSKEVPMCAFIYKIPTGKEFWCKVSILNSKGKSGRTGRKMHAYYIVQKDFYF